MRTHDDAVSELIEWFEDVAGLDADLGIGARCVVLPVAEGWARTTVLECLADHVAQQDHRQALAVTLEGREAPDGVELQAAWLPTALRAIESRQAAQSWRC